MSTDRDPVQLDESFNLIFEAQGSAKAQPDLSPLEKDLEILSSSQGSQINIVNGQYSATTRWTLQVMARRAGRITLPPIKFGKESSPSLTFSVTERDPLQGQKAAEARGDIFLEVDAQPRNPYVQAQVVYTVRLYRAGNTKNATLSEPRLLGTQAIVEKLGEDVALQAVLDGRRYRVVERKYALFPQQSGEVSIAPVVFEAEVGGTPRSLFDPFVQGARLVRKRSESLSLNVRPIPPGFVGKTWLPARQLELQEAWTEPPLQLKVGEPITRTLALIADGLTASQLPELSSATSSSFKSYEDQPELRDDKNPSGVIGIRQDRVALIPTREGEFVLPAMTIAWWNTETDRLEHAQLPERTLQVSAGQLGAPTPTSSSQGHEKKTPSPFAPSATTSEPPQPFEVGRDEWLWKGVSAILALAWMGTLFVWWRSRARSRPPKTRAPNRRAGLRATRTALREACAADDPDATHAALRAWAAQMWPNDPPRNLGEIGKRIGDPLNREIMSLNQALYAPRDSEWTGTSFWAAFETNKPTDTRAEQIDREPDLDPLFKT